LKPIALHLSEHHDLRIGTAGWTLPRQHAHLFPAQGSHLERYAQTFNCVEINSSFHRPHQRKTWERWAASTPADFHFSVKLPKTITHDARLVSCGALLLAFFQQVRGLGEKLESVLVQLPPKLEFEEGLAREFLATLRELHQGSVALEPRHASWFTTAVDRLLREFKIARVAADPPKGSPLAAKPGGSAHLRYWRLHGAPRTYYSDYDQIFLRRFAKELRAEASAQQIWVIFDNTALGHATANAWGLMQCIGR
jgi:uncharacterized protein YecE (DUF72 family)